MTVRRRLAGASAILLACAALNAPVAQQQPPSTGPSAGVALVIGHQMGQPTQPTDGDARRDADRMAQRLTALGYRVLRENQPSLARFDELFLELEDAARASRTVVFYYAGPTAYLRNDVHAQTSDGGETVPLLEKFGSAVPVTAHRIAIIDGCRIVGPLGGPPPIVNAGSRMFVALANTVGTACADRGPLSPFTAALDRYLGEGETDLATLMDKTRTAVLAATKDQQVPWDVSTLGRRVSLLPAAGPTPPPAPRAPPSSPTSPAQALPVTPSPASPPPPARLGPSQWWHNGSLMELRANGKERAFYYVEPREGIARMGVTRGTVLFTGERTAETYAGTAHVFRGTCGKFPYPVSGTVSPDQRRVTLSGQAPLVDARCQVTGQRPDELIFDLRAEE